MEIFVEPGVFVGFGMISIPVIDVTNDLLLECNLNVLVLKKIVSSRFQSPFHFRHDNDEGINHVIVTHVLFGGNTVHLRRS
jgi:hypothetical protein